ncbi:MAG: YceI family protein, partial [Bacteroidota bacterium]
AKYPRARVNIKNITNGIMKGTLTIKGITKPITVPYKRVNSDKGIVLKGMVTIDRTLYGINYNSDSFFKNLGANAIKNTFDVNFKIKLNPL